MSASIKKRHDDIARRLKEHDAARKLIEAEMMALQHVCDHKNVKEWNHHDYGGGCDHHWVCQDCGKSRVT